MHNLRLSSEKTRDLCLPATPRKTGSINKQKAYGFRQDGEIRVYTAIILLLLLLTVSQVCAQAHFGYEVTNL